MTRALLLGLCLSACISEGDVQTALDGYCSTDEQKACEADDACCPGFKCVQAACRRLTANTCLFPDAGHLQMTGEWCGCSSDCVKSTCSAESMCD